MNIPACHKMSPKTVEKRRKRSWPVYLLLPIGRYKTWITLDEALFHLSSTTGKTKLQHISPKKRRKDADVWGEFGKDKLAVKCYGIDGNVFSRHNKTSFCKTNG
ncbi:hypothetical protein TNCV_1618191 [Trichonephila clavipes]|nr:hypothetical protein TNCV_1618191 [Trichonephila clavipes]